MGRVTEKTAYQDIRALLERGDFATAEKLIEKFSQSLTEDQRRELEKLRRSVGRRRDLSRWLRALRRKRRPRFLQESYRWSWILPPAGCIAYIGFGTVFLRPAFWRMRPVWFPRIVWGFLPPYLYACLPAFLYFTWKYIRELYRWQGAKSEKAEVLEIRQEDRAGQYPRSGQVYHYQTWYAVVRLLEPRRGEPETMRFYLYENANGRSLIRGGEENLHPWSFHPGDRVTLYRDRTGFPSLAHHTRRSLTRDWMGKMRLWGGWAALFCLLFSLSVRL